jgi:hypothetical protein
LDKVPGLLLTIVVPQDTMVIQENGSVIIVE